MITYLVRRILQSIPTIIGVTLIIFILLSLAPGDAAFLKAGFKRGRASPEAIEAMRKKLGLDKPAYLRYLLFLKNLSKGDLGYSYITEDEVADMVKERLLSSLKIVAFSLIISVVAGVSLGIASAMHQGSILDLVFSGAAIMGISIPRFWLGLLLMYFIGVKLGLLPTSGYGGGDPAYMVLPAVTLGMPYMALLARITRASVLDKVNEDYIRTAYAKGLSKWVVSRRHLLRNALLPIVTIIGLTMGSMLANIIIVEQVFGWPGIGDLMLRSIFTRDIPVVQGTILIVLLLYIVANLTVDMLYVYIDPRIRL